MAGIWEGITSGALWAGKAGLKVGAVVGAIAGGLAAGIFLAPAGALVASVGILAGVVAGAATGAVLGGLEYGSMGAVAGAVNGDPKAPVRDSTPYRGADLEAQHAQEVETRQYRDMIAAQQQRANGGPKL